jgi:hypothetical protein
MSLYKEKAINQSKGRKTNGLYTIGDTLKALFIANNSTLYTGISRIKTMIPEMPANT